MTRADRVPAPACPQAYAKWTLKRGSFLVADCPKCCRGTLGFVEGLNEAGLVMRCGRCKLLFVAAPPKPVPEKSLP